MINHSWNARYVELTKGFDSSAVAGKIHWMLESTTNEMLNYANRQYGAIETNIDHSTLLAMSTQDALVLVLSALGTEEVARLEQVGADQLQQMVIPVNPPTDPTP
jgi:regulator of sigma D